MSNSIDRRDFLGRTAAGGAAMGLAMSGASAWAARSANEKVVVAVMGLSRGRSLAVTFAKQAGVEVKYCCDVDERRAARGADAVENVRDKRPEETGDVRRVLDDPEVDALVCAAPNHWHGPATIMACAAGKHVYVEKPCCHNPREGELMVAAARKHNRAVQVGTQRRSGDGINEGIKLVRQGAIGRVYYSRCWYANSRGSIGRGQKAEVPGHLDYELWQGPAPRQPYYNNRVHYNWHWFWHWGNGELGNNGVHAIDLARWGLGVDYPVHVASNGGRYAFDDDQETADTHLASFKFEGDKQIAWEGLSCNRLGINRSGFGITFHGTEGSMALSSSGYVLYDPRNREVKKGGGSLGQNEHVANFVAAIRNDRPLELNAEIEEGYKSTLLCLLGNIAHRTGRTLNCDPADGHILDDERAMQFWSREYEKGWEPTV